MKKLILILLITVNFGYAQKTHKEDTLATTTSVSFEEMITPYIQDILSFTKKGAQFVFAEAPDVIKQYIMYTAVDRWLSVLFSIFIIILGTIIIPRRLTFAKEPDDGFKYHTIFGGRYIRYEYSMPTIEEIGYWVSVILGAIAGPIVFFNNIMDAIKVTFFPKLYLVETFINVIT